MRNTTDISNIHADPAVKQRRGAVVPFAAVLMVVLFAMVAFTIDMGYIVHVDTELQRTADACALSSAQFLPDEEMVIATAQAVAIENFRTSGPELDVSDIEFGTWDRHRAEFTSGTSEPNAVKVTVRRTAASGNPLELFFAPMMGTSYADVSDSAIAIYDNYFCGPLIGIEWIDVPGGPITDSYSSAKGRYKEQKASDNGSLCSDGPIALDGNPIVNGHANPGKGFQTTLEGSAIVTKSTTPRLEPLNLPPVDDSEAAETNDNESIPLAQKDNGNTYEPVDSNGNFLIDGGVNYTLPSGTYYLNDFEVTGQSTVTFDPSGGEPVIIYLTGNLDTAGGDIFNTSEIPRDVQIYMTGGYADVAANMEFYGMIYAPNTDMILRGGGDLFGAFVGKNLTLTGNGMVHYDEDLDLANELGIPYSVTLVE